MLMKKRVEAIIERYGSLKGEDGTVKEEHKGVWGYQIKINGGKPYTFAQNYIVPLNGDFLIKDGYSFETSKEVKDGIAHNIDEANKKAYENIMGKEKSKLDQMIKRSGLEVDIIDKHPIFSQ